MTSSSFRKIALSFPEVEERSHMAHPDFRVSGKIFATLGYPRAGWGMTVLPPKEQARFVRENPDAFSLASGAWGRQGSTMINLRLAKTGTVRKALIAAWRNKAPKKLAAQIDLQ
ncbi:MAG TPA: MmcQ/YjbR family DNA-binding protein [Bacteroidota bacterium]